MRVPLLIATLPFSLPATAAAQEIPNWESVGAVQGECKKLVVAGRDRSSECRPAVAVLIYRDGRKSFAFSGEGMMVSFSGTREESSGNEARLTLDAVTVASYAAGGEVATDPSPATGTCEFSNPWAGRSYIRCVATTPSGKFRGLFNSDGRPPDMQKF